MKKYFIYILVACSALSFSACDSLDMSPESSITDANYWKTPAQFQAFNNGLHSLVRSRSYEHYVLGENRANYFLDDPFGGEATQGLERLPYNTINKVNTGLSNFANLYPQINQINLMIDKTEATSILSPSDKSKYLGIAYGLRGYLYFHLLRSWGDVILHLHGTDGADFDLSNLKKEASPAAEVLAQIKSDIQRSEDAFGLNYSFNEGRYFWSLAATKMLKGEVYLWSGRQCGGGESDYRIAKQALMDVSDADVELLDNFESVFAYSKSTVKNKEVIFVLHNGENEYQLWGDNYKGTMLPQSSYLNSYFDEDGVQFQDYNAANVTFGLIRRQFNYDMYQTFFNDNDPRKRSTFKGVYKKNEEGGLDYFALYPCKFKGTLITGNSSATVLNDNVVYRYADCLLLLATAKAFLGEDISNEINQVRSRAYGEEYFEANKATVAYPNDTQGYENNRYVGSDADPLEAILKERARELVLEGKRWYDLRLMGWDYVKKYTLAQEKRLLWPINESALTNNPGLVQTPGYED